MSDFMLWLHANYIRPQIDAAEKEDYEFHFDLVRNDLPPSARSSMEKCLQFTAIHAFLLGLRTGTGLALSQRQGNSPAASGGTPFCEGGQV